MAISAVALPFTSSQIQSQRYGTETVVYTWGPNTLPMGQTPVFRVSSWNKSGGPLLECRSTYLAASQVDGVQFIWTEDNATTNTAQGWVSGLRAGVQANPGLDVSALNTFGLTLNNTTGAAIADFQLNYTVTVHPLTMAEKLMRGIALSDQDYLDLKALGMQQGQSALEGLQNDVLGGLLPRSPEWFRQAVWDGRRVRDNPNAVPTLLDATSTGNTINLQPPSTAIVQVLRGIAVENAPNCVVTVERDGQPDYVTLNAEALVAADDLAIPLWVPSTDYLTISVYGAATTVYLRPIVANYATSSRLLAHMQQQTVPIKTYAKVRAGWL